MSGLNHSMAPKQVAAEAFRVTVGADNAAKPYAASVLNVSGMSFGAISPNAIRSLNRGAMLGGFAQVTGEGAVSRYHLQHGGDLIWQIGSGYFGCRDQDGGFNAGRFAETASLDQVKMIEVKLSQGAKPGHGGFCRRPRSQRKLPAPARFRAIGTVFRPPRTAPSQHQSSCSNSSPNCGGSQAATGRLQALRRSSMAGARGVQGDG